MVRDSRFTMESRLFVRIARKVLGLKSAVPLVIPEGFPMIESLIYWSLSKIGLLFSNGG
jgi:hypothetical protein